MEFSLRSLCARQALTPDWRYSVSSRLIRKRKFSQRIFRCSCVAKFKRIKTAACHKIELIPQNTAASRYRYGLDKLRTHLRPLYDELK